VSACGIPNGDVSTALILMPGNRSPEDAKADKRYRQASTHEERLMALRDMLSIIPKHKGTEKMQATPNAASVRNVDGRMRLLS
jgi:hypothetical protein